MNKTAAKIIIGIWSVILVFCIGMFIFFANVGDWGNRIYWSPFSPDRNYSYVQLKEQSIPDEVDSLDISWRGGDVLFYETDADEIKIIQHGVKNTPEAQFFTTTLNGGTLTVKDGKKAAGLWIGPFSYSIGSDLDIYLPQKMYRALSVETVGGDVNIRGWNAERIDLKSVSGDLSLEGAYTELSMHTTSGEMIARSIQTEQLSIGTVSGDASVSGSIGKIDAGSTSGEIILRSEILPESTSIHTVSGDISLGIPENDGFTLHFNSVSGDLSTSFQTYGDKHTMQYKDGGAQIDLNTTSGDVHLHKE